MKRRSIISILVLIVLAGSAAVSGQQAAPPAGTPAAENQLKSSQERVRIGPGDLLEVLVFDIPELTQAVRVTDTGSASLLLLGTVQLAGRTPGEAQQIIEQGLRDGRFVNDPHVTVMIREYATQGVSVLGEVKKPGVYPVLGGRTLLDILSEAGGTTPIAAADITIKRRDPEQAPIVVSITNDSARALAKNVEVYPGDTVIVPHAGLVYVVGEVVHPGGFVMQNNGSLTVVQAVALAEGPRPSAALGHAKIVRKTDNGYTETAIPLKKMLQARIPDMALQPEDIIFVPNSTGKTVAKRSLEAIVQAASGSVIYSARNW